MLKHISHRIVLLIVVAALLPVVPATCWAFASANIPLDSPIYFYLDKLFSHSYGLGLKIPEHSQAFKFEGELKIRGKFFFI
jgi:hypothetical protein